MLQKFPARKYICTYIKQTARETPALSKNALSIQSQGCCYLATFLQNFAKKILQTIACHGLCAAANRELKYILCDTIMILSSLHFESSRSRWVRLIFRTGK
jgi:hypothetical protein